MYAWAYFIINSIILALKILANTNILKKYMQGIFTSKPTLSLICGELVRLGLFQTTCWLIILMRSKRFILTNCQKNDLCVSKIRMRLYCHVIKEYNIRRY